MIESESQRKRKFHAMRSQQRFRLASDVDLEGTSSSLEQEQGVTNSIIARLEDVRELIMPVVIPMQEKIDFLELQVTVLTKELDTLRKDKQSSQQLKEQSKKTAIELRKMFNLQEIKPEDKEISLSSLKGMFEEYANEEIDSVELLRSIRDEEK